MSRVWGTFWQDPERVSKRVDLRLLARAWRFVRPYRAGLFAYLVVTATASVLGVAPALVFKRIVDTAIPQRDLGALLWLCAGLVVVFLASDLLLVAQQWTGLSTGSQIILSLRLALYDHLQRMPLAFFTRTQTGLVQSRIMGDVNEAENLFTETLSATLTDLLGLVVTLVAMAFLSWQVTLVIVLLVPLILLPTEFVGRSTRRLSRARMKLWGELTAVTSERLSVAGALLVKLFGTYPTELSTFGRRAKEVRDTSVRIFMLQGIFTGALSLTSSLALVAIYYIGGRQVIGGSLSLGTVIALATLVQRVYGPVIDLATTRLNLVTGLLAFERVFEVLDTAHWINERAGAVPLSRPAGRVELAGVWFRYPAPTEVSIASLEIDADGRTRKELPDDPSDWVLKDVTLEVEPGTMTALVGPSGAGKTTLCYLVARLYDVTRGSVRVDGHDVRDLTTASLAGAIAMVPQDPHLFHDTIAANLRYARPGASDDELREACRAAQLDGVISTLPDGYQTMVGERGYRMSGGEKQRLAIARAILKDPAILVLDEATSHLDNETEALVQAALRALLQGRTSLVIAHRLSTVRAADQILVLEGGRVIERGRHATLLRHEGLYAGLYRTGLESGSAGS